MRCEHLIKLITFLFMHLMLSFVACGVENKTDTQKRENLLMLRVHAIHDHWWWWWVKTPKRSVHVTQERSILRFLFATIIWCRIGLNSHALMSFSIIFFVSDNPLPDKNIWRRWREEGMKIFLFDLSKEFNLKKYLFGRIKDDYRESTYRIKFN